jgi:hypothetical protein
MTLSLQNDLKLFYEKGFSFFKIEIEENLLKDIHAIEMYDIANYNKIELERYTSQDAKIYRRFVLSETDKINRIIFDKIKNNINPYFQPFMNQYIKSELHCFSTGEKMDWHNDLKQNALFLILVWIPENDLPYKGREICFKNDKTGIYHEHQPKVGDVCIFDNTNPDLQHMVKELLTDKKVVTFTYDLGSFK